jgi:AraC-like DNA-binding protein
MDALSDVLRAIRLSGAVFMTADFSSPWSVGSALPSQLATLMPAADHCAVFHVLADGRCWIDMEGLAPMQINAGDALVFPRGDPHVMRSDTSLAPTSVVSLLPRPPYRGVLRLSYGGAGKEARLISGYLNSDLKLNPLFSSLPKLLYLRHGGGSVVMTSVGDGAVNSQAIPPDAAAWLRVTVRHMIVEATAPRPGQLTILARLAELLLVEMLRLYVQERSAGQAGWLFGVRDPHMGRVLALMHDDPSKAWTVETLAREAGISRSGLAARFLALIGTSPMRYLCGWRMHLARQLLRDGGLPIPEVAARVGYKSQYAFNRAFKRCVGVPPAAWRKTETTTRPARSPIG